MELQSRITATGGITPTTSRSMGTNLLPLAAILRPHLDQASLRSRTGIHLSSRSRIGARDMNARWFAADLS